MARKKGYDALIEQLRGKKSRDNCALLDAAADAIESLENAAVECIKAFGKYLIDVAPVHINKYDIPDLLIAFLEAL